MGSLLELPLVSLVFTAQLFRGGEAAFTRQTKTAYLTMAVTPVQSSVLDQCQTAVWLMLRRSLINAFKLVYAMGFKKAIICGVTGGSYQRIPGFFREIPLCHPPPIKSTNPASRHHAKICDGRYPVHWVKRQHF